MVCADKCLVLYTFTGLRVICTRAKNKWRYGRCLGDCVLIENHTENAIPKPSAKKQILIRFFDYRRYDVRVCVLRAIDNRTLVMYWPATGLH